MITRADLRYNFLTLKYIARWLNIFDIYVQERDQQEDGRWASKSKFSMTTTKEDQDKKQNGGGGGGEFKKNWKLVKRNNDDQSQMKRLLRFLWQLTSSAYLTFLIFRSIVSIWIIETSGHHQVPLMVIGVLGVSMAGHMAHVLFFQHPDLNLALINEFLNCIREHDPKRDKDGGNFDFLTILQRHTIPELIVCYFPFLAYPIVAMLPVIYVADPDVPTLFISAVDPNSRSLGVYALCFCLDGITWIQHVGAAHYCGFFVVSFFVMMTEKTGRETKRLKWQVVDKLCKKIGQKWTTVSHACMAARHLQLLMLLFNIGFSNLVYHYKMACLGMGVTGGFAAIKLRAEHPHHATFYAIVMMSVVVGFNGTFNTAFRITDGMKNLKSAILLKAISLKKKEKRLEYGGMAAAIPQNVGVALSGFHKTERSSTPKFVDFLVQKIVDLLLTV